MTGRPVPEGALFYGETKRRLVVPFDAELRRLTEETAVAFGALVAQGRTPPPVWRASRCRACSLIELCRPKAMTKSALGYPEPRARRRARRRRPARRAVVKKLLNTLYATTEGASLRKDGENLVAEIDGAERGRVPLHMLGSVVVFGGIFVSPPLIGALARAGITLVLLDRQGRFEARVEGPVSGNVLLRRAQYRASEQPDDIVRSIVSAKIANQRDGAAARLARPWRRDAGARAAPTIEAAVDRLERILRRVAYHE